MKIITPRTHGYIDYLTVVLFLAAPSALGFGGTPAKLAWLLAVVHLVLTLATNFPLGLFRYLPFPIHGWVERIVGPALLAVAFFPDFSSVPPAFAFFAVMGAAIVVVGWTTDYADAPSGTPIETR